MDRAADGFGKRKYHQSNGFPLYLYAMVYNVIGLMSGSSLDGLDIVFTKIETARGKWSYDAVHAACLPYSATWVNDLKHVSRLPVGDFLKLNTRYGRYLGAAVNDFIAAHSLQHQVHFVASHGHTVFHEPENATTFQLGCGASICAETGIPVISDLRAIDVALGGQGAPIVPIGDKLLFSEYNFCLNIGGITNITICAEKYTAFDVCPANQILNTLAGFEGAEMDDNGNMAAIGTLLDDVLDKLNNLEYYNRLPPKSLNNETAINMIFPCLTESQYTTADLLHTYCHHIAAQVVKAVTMAGTGSGERKMLVTGGGAYNGFLTGLLKEYLHPMRVSVEIPDTVTVKYKEAIIMALIGVLKWRGENNALCSATGAMCDSIGGALWGMQ
jgi:anhydro-N-acetylmuramic acid kinase